MNTFPKNNPFGITKATDFSDNEINEYWVNVNPDYKILNPNELLPKYILGGKGCGKTHLLRYFSYPLQKIRKGNLSRIVNDDKYIGIYSVLDGINSSRFKGKGIDEEQWKSAFEYYFELYISDILLNISKDVFADGISKGYSEKDFVRDISLLFYENVIDINELQSIDDFLERLSVLRKKIDLEIVNAAFNRTLNISTMRILFSPGDLLFGIPALLSKNIALLQNVQFVYILDEYEKLFEWQKVFVNTLVWEKKQPCTFWIGARKYGYTTTQTKTEEQIKPGSEFQPILLDEIFQGDDVLYKKFAKELYLNRLKKYYLNDMGSIVEPKYILIVNKDGTFKYEKVVCYEFNEKFNSPEQNLIISNFPINWNWAFLELQKRGVNITNCLRCKFYKRTMFKERICTLYKKYGTPKSPKISEARKCSRYTISDKTEEGFPISSLTPGYNHSEDCGGRKPFVNFVLRWK